MKDWLTQYQYDGKISRLAIVVPPNSVPTDGFRATKINEEVSRVPVDDLSVVEQYVLGCYYYLGIGLSFTNDGTSDVVGRVLTRLTGMVKKGKVWLGDQVPVALHIYELTDDVVQAFENKIRQGSVSPIIKLLFKEQEHRERKFEKKSFYLANKEHVTPNEIHPDLKEICLFQSSANWPVNFIFLHVSGWSFEELECSNEVLSMLLTQCNELELIVSPSTGRVECIRQFDRLK